MKPTTDEVLAWALEAGTIGTEPPTSELQRLFREAIIDALPDFAALAYASGAAAMRERAAKVCEDATMGTNVALVGVGFAEAIRALGDDDE